MLPSSNTLHTFLYNLSRREPDKKLLGDKNGWLTATQTAQKADALACVLSRLGVGFGTLVALRAERCVETVLAILALQAIGAIAVLTDPRRPAEDFLADRAPDIPVCTTLDPERGFLSFRPVAGGVYSIPIYELPHEPVVSQKS